MDNRQHKFMGLGWQVFYKTKGGVRMPIFKKSPERAIIKSRTYDRRLERKKDKSQYQMEKALELGKESYRDGNKVEYNKQKSRYNSSSSQIKQIERMQNFNNSQRSIVEAKKNTEELVIIGNEMLKYMKGIGLNGNKIEKFATQMEKAQDNINEQLDILEGMDETLKTPDYEEADTEFDSLIKSECEAESGGITEFEEKIKEAQKK